MGFLAELRKQQPTAADVHVNVPMTTFAVGYLRAATDTIANRMFSAWPSDLPTGIYYKYNRGDWYRIVARERAPGAESAGGGFNVAPDLPYRCRVKAVHKDLADQTLNSQMAPIDLEKDSTLWVTQQMALLRDLDWINGFWKTGIWTDVDSSVATPGLNSGIRWSAAGSAPISELRRRMTLFKRTTTKKPNKLAMSGKVWDVIADHPDFLARVNFGTVQDPSIVSPNLLAQILMIDEVVILDQAYNVAGEKDADDFEFMASDACFFCYADPNPSLMTATAGAIFNWTGAYGGTAYGESLRVTSWREEKVKSTRYEAEMAYDMHVVANDLGVFMSNVI